MSTVDNSKKQQLQMSEQLQEALSSFTLNLTHISQIIQNDSTLLSVPNKYGLIPIQVAAKRSNSSLIKLIVELGGDVEVIDSEGKTPVAIACQTGSLYAVHTFNDCGANMSTKDGSDRTMMHHAASIGAVHLMHYLHEVCNISYHDKDIEGYTPLHMAVWNRNGEAVKYLLRKKCKASVKNMYGTTPMSIAAKTGSRLICRSLILSTKENLLLIKDGNGLSPLDHANKGTSIVHKNLSFKMAEWTSSHLRNSFPYYDTFLFYFIMIAPGLSLMAATAMIVHFPYLLVSIPIAIVIVVFGFFGTIVNHRLPNDAEYQNPGAFGAFISGLVLTLICYFSTVFPCIWPHNLFWFLIGAIDYLLIIYVFWKIEHADPGFDKIGKTKTNGKIMSILDIAKQDSQSGGIQYTFCTHCEIVIPEYTKHCKLCAACCNGFDHHCLWLRTCIGRRNHRLFVIFLFTLALDNMLFVRAVISALSNESGYYSPLLFVKYGIQHERFMLFFMLCNFATGIFGLLNLLYQLSIISMKETTYFDVSGKIAYGRKRQYAGTPLLVRLIVLKEFFFNYEKWCNDRLKSRNALLV